MIDTIHKCVFSRVALDAVVLRTNILHAHGLDSITILFKRDGIPPNAGNSQGIRPEGC